MNSHEQNVAWVIDCDYNSNTSCFAGEINDFENLSLELKLVSTGGGSLNWALGGYWQETERYFAQEVIFAGAENSAADPTTDMLHMIKFQKLMEKPSLFMVNYGI